MVDFSGTLRALRLAEDMTQQQVAQRIGVTASMVSAYENGLRQPSYEMLPRLAALFHVSTDYILGSKAAKTGYDLDGLTVEQRETVLKIIKNMKAANTM